MYAPALPGMRPIEQLAANRPHGDRLRYKAGCCCAECRRANSRYESERQKARKAGDWNGFVPAEKARAHILKLSRAGVGRRAVAAASDVSETTVAKIRYGIKLKIRARTERRILAVTPKMASDHAIVPAQRTWTLIERLVEEGYTKAQLAQRLGYSTPKIQLSKRRVTVRNAYDVERLYRTLTS